MAEIYDFDKRLETVRKITKDADAWADAAQAAEIFARAVDALQVEFQPRDIDSKANTFYYSLLREYYLEAAGDVEGFCDDDDDVG